MKKLILLAVAVCIGLCAMSQRPVQSRQVNRNAENVCVDRTNNVVRTGAAAKTYSYIVSEMSIANVSVMDYATTVKQEGRTDKVKVTINNCSVSISYYLYDANDQAVAKNTLSSNGGMVDMSNFQPGEYRLQIIEQKGAERNFKIIKKLK